MSEFEHGFGMVASELDPRDYVFTASISKAKIPDEYLPELKVGVHDQGKINNCATHALSAAIENSLGGKMAFSWYYGNRRYTEYTGQGTIERDLLKAAQKDGGLVWNTYPYEEEMTKAMERFEANAAKLLPTSKKLTIGDYWALNSFEQVREALYAGKLVQLGLQLFNGIRNVTAKDPVLHEPKIDKDGVVEEWIGGHMVWATGYCVKNGVKCIRCRNSWGDEWGEKGSFYVPEGYFTWSQKYGFPMQLTEPWAFELGTHEEKPTGWYKDNGKWRYHKDGGDVTGWLHLQNVWYYIDPDGYMVANNWRKINNLWYYFTSSGSMATGWRKISGWWYYLNAHTDANGPCGAMLTGLKTIAGKKYYFSPQTVDGFPAGALIITDDNGVIKENK